MVKEFIRTVGRRTILFCFVVLLLWVEPGVTAAAQDTARAVPAGVVLPPDGFLPGWVREEPLRQFTAKNLYGYINGGAELFLEFGFAELLVQPYTDEGRELILEAYTMKSAPAALGIYLTRCGDETPLAGITARNSGDPYQFTIVRDNCMLLVNNFDGDSTLLPVMTVLAQHTVASLPEATPVTLFDYLPQDSLVAGSERLIRGPYGLQPIFTLGQGDILQLGGKIFAVIGEYASGDHQTYTQIIVPYPAKKIAAAAYANLLANLDPYLKIIDQSDRTFVFQDFQQKFGTASLKDSTITINVRLAQRPEIK